MTDKLAIELTNETGRQARLVRAITRAGRHALVALRTERARPAYDNIIPGIALRRCGLGPTIARPGDCPP